jgi:hypothetical protein
MQPPTTREIVLVITLLIGLVTFSQRSEGVHAPDLAVIPPDSNHSAPLDASLYAPSSRMNWGDSSVPFTTLVAHVPGTTSDYMRKRKLIEECRLDYV